MRTRCSSSLLLPPPSIIMQLSLIGFVRFLSLLLLLSSLFSTPTCGGLATTDAFFVPRSRPNHYYHAKSSLYRRNRRTFHSRRHSFTKMNSAASSSSSSSASSSVTATTAAAIMKTIKTKPIAGMKPGTSGLRKKVEVWQGIDKPDEHKNYLENFIQSLLNTVANRNGGTMPNTILVAGDGRYYNTEAIQIICRILAGNGIQNIWIPTGGGIMSTPAVSAVVRNRIDRSTGNKCQGGIVLTASHNPGGPGEDFGIKYNLEYGQPAGEDFTDELYERSLQIQSYQTIEGGNDIDIFNAPVGTEYQLTSTTTVTMIDPYEDYITVLKQCFDFDALSKFVNDKNKQFTMIFDGMHGAGGPFAKKVLIDLLGLPSETTLFRCNPLPDFGQCHPDPNLTYAAELIQKMGLLSDGSTNPNIDTMTTTVPTLGVANDGDGDRNLIAGAGCFVTPSDSLAIICDNADAIPHFTKNGGGIKGVARSMPTSAALDVVAKAKNIPCFITPTGWKFFGNLMSSKELFDGTDYTPFLCGEESFGTGSDHVREKDGLWAALAWMSIIMKANTQKDDTISTPLVSVKDIVSKHWAKYGRHYYCRYDYENVNTNDANQLMDRIRTEFVVATTTKNEQQQPKKESSNNNDTDDDPIQLVNAEEFSYTDPVDGSHVTNQGLILNFQYTASGDTARVVFRLSGTGSSGATIRMYLEKYEPDPMKHNMSAPVALQSLAQKAIELVQMKQITGRDSPTVIT